MAFCRTSCVIFLFLFAIQAGCYSVFYGLPHCVQRSVMSSAALSGVEVAFVLIYAMLA